MVTQVFVCTAIATLVGATSAFAQATIEDRARVWFETEYATLWQSPATLNASKVTDAFTTPFTETNAAGRAIYNFNRLYEWRMRFAQLESAGWTEASLELLEVSHVESTEWTHFKAHWKIEYSNGAEVASCNIYSAKQRFGDSPLEPQWKFSDVSDCENADLQRQESPSAPPYENTGQRARNGRVDVALDLSNELIALYPGQIVLRESIAEDFEALAISCEATRTKEGAEDCLQAGHAYLTGDEVPQKISRGIELFTHGCHRRKSRWNCYALFDAAQGRRPKVVPDKDDPSRSYEVLVPAKEGQNWVTVRDALARADQLVFQQCQDEAGWACLERGLIYRNGPRGDLYNLERSLRYLTWACDGGVYVACRKLRGR